MKISFDFGRQCLNIKCRGSEFHDLLNNSHDIRHLLEHVSIVGEVGDNENGLVPPHADEYWRMAAESEREQKAGVKLPVESKDKGAGK